MRNAPLDFMPLRLELPRTHGHALYLPYRLCRPSVIAHCLLRNLRFTFVQTGVLENTELSSPAACAAAAAASPTWQPRDKAQDSHPCGHLPTQKRFESLREAIKSFLCRDYLSTPSPSYDPRSSYPKEVPNFGNLAVAHVALHLSAPTRIHGFDNCPQETNQQPCLNAGLALLGCCLGCSS